ncbi:MAG: beta-lactamase family protein [Faecalicatena sp.]|uniref:serine hydrolase domain-containing protein n=1 Tax=Faecalicatena sp. TaxID=2005360 RepID=UPI002586BA86|nr:serine hydrolase [Faecalicatena sp.]MCI6465426.1 beta-lactamase family protein [Faecalicatena sp.]MDY5617258.1 serine hydrolase [Lachnospiraceae bacterium]
MERLERAAAAACNVDPLRLAEMYEELGKYNVHSVMVTRHGKVIAEGWWAPYKAEYNHIQYSVSKSFVGTAIGLAVSEGLLTVEDRILDILDGILPSRPCENMEKLTIRHVLTMSTGYRTERNMFQEGESWIYSLLSSYIDDEPGKEFRYISSSTYILSAVIHKLTGQNVFDYLKPRLFEPLGFSENIWWETSPEGLNTGFNGLNATAEDITKLALLYLNNGQWKGRQILPKDWVREASDIQIRNIHNDKNQKLGYRQGFGRFSEDWKSGYGYLFWHCVPKGAYRGDGIYGQMCVVMPEQDMTVAVAAGCSEPDRILDIVWKYLLPAVDVVCTNDEAQHILERKLRELEIPTVKGEQYHPNQEYLSGRVFKVARNGAGIWQIGFLFPENGMPSVSIVTEKGIFKAWIGYEKWVENETGYDPDGFSCDNVIFFNDAALSGAWQEDEYVIKLVYTRTPFVDTLRVRFLDGRIAGSYTHTVKYGQKSYEIIGIED